MAPAAAIIEHGLASVGWMFSRASVIRVSRETGPPFRPFLFRGISTGHSSLLVYRRYCGRRKLSEWNLYADERPRCPFVVPRGQSRDSQPGIAKAVLPKLVLFVFTFFFCSLGLRISIPYDIETRHR